MLFEYVDSTFRRVYIMGARNNENGFKRNETNKIETVFSEGNAE